MDKADENEDDEPLTTEQVRAALEEINTRKEKYTEYLNKLTETRETQILETDPEAHRMHTKDGFHCCYNVQTAVDAGSHLIAEYEVTNHNTDQGLLNEFCNQTKDTLEVETIEVIADKGYESREDILNCLMNGTVPNVAMKYGKNERIYNIDYEEAEITSDIKASVAPEDIKKCFHAGVLPDCYTNTSVSVELQELSTIGCFTKNDDGTITCPMNQMLSKVRINGNNTVYANKVACNQCSNRCTWSSKHKTVSFGPESTHIAVWMYGTSRHSVISPPDNHIYHNSFLRKDMPNRKVVIFIKEDKEKLKQRMCHSEHPFGTIKWYHGAHYLLCRGKEKATGEIGLSFLAYNIRRAITLVGVPKLIEAIRG